MNIYQFFSKESTVIHAECKNDNFEDEKSQLLKQDFELSGDVISAENTKEAYEIYKSKFDLDNIEYPFLSQSINVPQAIALRAILGG